MIYKWYILPNEHGGEGRVFIPGGVIRVRQIW